MLEEPPPSSFLFCWQVTGNADVWELYGDYHCSSSDLLDQEKVGHIPFLLYLQKNPLPLSLSRVYWSCRRPRGVPGRRRDGTGSGQVWRELPNSPSNTATVSSSSSLPMVIDVCVSVECRELSETRKDGGKSVQSLSSAKMALQGLITKTKVPFSLFLSSLLFSLFSLSLLIQVTC